MLSRVRDLAAKDPSLRERQPYKAAIEGDAAYFHEAGAKAVVELLMAGHSNMTQEQFAATARQFLQTETAPEAEPALHRHHLSADDRATSLFATKRLSDMDLFRWYR